MDEIIELCHQQDAQGGIDMGKLPPGTKILVRTKNHLYVMEKLDHGPERILIKGGDYFPTPTAATFAGSTFGGTCIRTGWIGYEMHMEFHFDNLKRIVTTPVREATIIAPTYQYTMNWKERREGI